ncbi:MULTISPECIES: glucose uptake inhibitor SgrT [Symbiopectobacterium]|uniref:glucose uptake inhibitor SgrT n=1 Tax=Symbiopectobacterium TaxID=801 RepID=UPI002079C9A7|nr:MULTISPECIES: glucose uptake inhibitor SgrT [Symbiopectobacterium]
MANGDFTAQSILPALLLLALPWLLAEGISAQQKLALLQQVTQWHTDAMSEEEYRHWL